MYCSNCGQPLGDTDIFCSQCGNKVKTNTAKTNTAKTTDFVEEVVYNEPRPEHRASQDKGHDPLGQAQFGAPFKQETPQQQIPLQQIPPQRMEEAKRSVYEASGPKEGDFVWNVHQFQGEEIKPAEEIEFKWNLEDGSKFHTYNKSREEFQKLLDNEYVRTGKEVPFQQDEPIVTMPDTRYRPEPPQLEEAYIKPEMPMTRSIEETYKFDPVDHVHRMEMEREAIFPEVKEVVGPEIREFNRSEEQKFNTMELKRDLLQVGLDEAAKTQIIEKIFADDNLGSIDDFDIKKTKFISKSKKGEEEKSRQDFSQPIDIAEVSEKDQDEEMDGKLAKLWDTDTAPIPIVSIPSMVAATHNMTAAQEATIQRPTAAQEATIQRPTTAQEATIQEATLGEDLPLKRPALDDDYYGDIDEEIDEEYYYSSKKKGGFFGKFIIALIIIVLIIEGSILGLRNFAPESAITEKANEVILNIQNWVESTILKK